MLPKQSFELLACLHVHDPGLINIAPNGKYVFIFQVYYSCDDENDSTTATREKTHNEIVSCLCRLFTNHLASTMSMAWNINFRTRIAYY